MKTTDLLTCIFGIAGALAGYFLLARPLSWLALGISAGFVMWTLLAVNARGRPVLRLAGLSWSMEDFVPAGSSLGALDPEKTQCAINTITYQIFP